MYELDSDGKQLRVVSCTEYTANTVRTLYRSAAELRAAWAEAGRRQEVIDGLAERGIDFGELATAAGQPDADPLDLVCHVAFNAPIRSRRERADRVRKQERAFSERYGPEARSVLEELLEKYASHGEAQVRVPEVLKVPPISEHGNVSELISAFGGDEQLREAVEKLQKLLYAA